METGPFGMWMSNSRQKKYHGGSRVDASVRVKERACMSSRRSGRLRHMEVAGVNAIFVARALVKSWYTRPTWEQKGYTTIVHRRTSSGRWVRARARIMMRPMYRCMDGALAHHYIVDLAFGYVPCMPKDVCACSEKFGDP